MKKILKLVILFIISMSVYYIYKGTKDSNTIILNIGDELAVGINSFGIDDYSYADYYKLKIESYNTNVEIINNYAEDNLSLKLLQEKLKNTNEIKKDLINSHILFICLGYNDLKYKLSLEENININRLNLIISQIESDYNNVIKEIRKYYKNKIIVIGYYNTNSTDYYLNNGIIKLNRVLKNNKDVVFIDTYNEIKGDYYLSNPGSYYPNNKAYQLIADKIIAKTLEN